MLCSLAFLFIHNLGYKGLVRNRKRKYTSRALALTIYAKLKRIDYKYKKFPKKRDF